MLSMLRAYLVPTPPTAPAHEVRQAPSPHEASPQPRRSRRPLDLWSRHMAEQARRRNREWLSRYGLILARRWAVLAGLLWGLALLSAGHPWLAAPAILLAALATGGGLLMLSIWGAARAAVRC